MRAISIVLLTILSLVCIFALENREIFVDLSDPEIAIPVRVDQYERSKRAIKDDYTMMQEKKKVSTPRGHRKGVRAREKLEW